MTTVSNNELVLLDHIETPQSLIEMPTPEFERVVEAFVQTGGSLLNSIKRAGGIIAWAMRHQYRDSEYGPRLHALAERLGEHEDTLTRWRDRVTRELGLPMPFVTQDRSRARLQAAARQVRERTASDRAASSPTPRTGPAEPIELGGLGPASARSAVEQLLEMEAETLAESASTKELEALRTLVGSALAAQKRIALRARLAQSDERGRRTGTGR